MSHRQPSASVLRVTDGIGDLLRLAALVAAVLALVLAGWSKALVFVVVFAIQLVPRVAALPRPVDLALGVGWLVAGTAEVAGWYLTHPWVDIPIHGVVPGVSAGALYLLLVRVELVPPLQDRVIRGAALVVLTVALGAAIAVLWEFYEWPVYHDVGPPLVGYDDTVLDLLMGSISSLLVGLALAAAARAGWRTRRHPLRAATTEPAR